MPTKVKDEVEVKKVKKNSEKGKATKTDTEKKAVKKVAEKKTTEKKAVTKKVAEKKTTEKKAATKKAAEKKTTAKKTATKKTAEKKTTAKKTATKKTVKKKTTAKKTATKKTAEKKTTAKKAATKKTAEKKATTKKVATKKPKASVTKIEKPEFLQEYYDLPYRYNETIVTILAQTPKRLFVYWDISDKDKDTYRRAFGDDFFDKTYPVLLVHNEELNYTFEVPINDFANSWYLDIQDSKKNYVVQLGRKFKSAKQAKEANFQVIQEEHIHLQNDYIYITDSNRLEAPNDHILFELLTNLVKYRNVKTGEEYTKNLKDIVSELISVYPAEIVHKLYTKLYAEELAHEDFGRRNPASGEFGEIGLPSSGALRSSGLW